MKTRKTFAVLLLIHGMALVLGTAQDNTPYLWEAEHVTYSPGMGGTELHAELESLISSYVASGHIAPLRGCATEKDTYFYYTTPGDMISALMEAYPYVNTVLQGQIRNYIAAEIAAYPPLSHAHYPLTTGKRREYYMQSTGTLAAEASRWLGMWGNDIARYKSGHYALWLYAYRTGDWSYLQSNLNTLHTRAISTYPLTVYEDIVNMIGWLRIAHRFNQASWVAEAENRLNTILNGNALNFNAMRTAAESRYSAEYTGVGKVNVFEDLSAEMGRFLRDKCLSAVQSYLDELNAKDALWFVANGPTMNELTHVYHPESSGIRPGTGQRICRAHARVLNASTTTLHMYLDAPECLWDPGYIHRLVLTLRKYAVVQWVDVRSTAPVNNPPTCSLTSPVNGSTFTAPAAVNLAATASDSDGSVVLVRFYSGTTLLNTDSASPYSYTWTGVAAGSYALTAQAQDNEGATRTSAVVNITVITPNQPPTVSLISPVNESTYTAPADILLTATATDPDGSIANVRFYRGTTLLNTDNASPYEYTWTNVSSGTYQLRAVAQDNQGATSTSTVVTVTVLSSSTPAVWYTLSATANPANGGTISPASGTYLAGSQIQVTATPNANYTFANWSGDATGTNPTVTITMDSNKSITANFTYVPPSNSSPTVSITSPNDGATYTAPASITITATAADSDGTIAAVRFYSGMTLLNTDSASPYSYTWTGVSAGSYVLTAQAQDNQGAVGISAAVGITVSAQPVYYTLTVNVNPTNGGTVALNPPPSGSGYLAGTQVTVTAAPGAGYVFVGWSGAVTSSATSIAIVMDGNKNLTANFQATGMDVPSGEVRVSGGIDGYVNPAEGPAMIYFNAPRSGQVTVSVFNPRGALVIEKAFDVQAGRNERYMWDCRAQDGTPAASGIYIVRITGAGLQVSRKVVIVR